MLKLQYDKTGEDLPIDIKKEMDSFIQSFEHVSWLKPSKDLTREEIEEQVGKVLKAFGVRAKIVIKKIETLEDWESATASEYSKTWLKAWDKQWERIVEVIAEDQLSDAKDLAWFASKTEAFERASKNGWLVNWTCAWHSAIAALEILVQGKGAFTELFKLWEMGVFPAGVVKKGRSFVVYVPFSSLEFPNI